MTTEPVGFHQIATADPTRVAIIEPDRRQISYGDLLGRVNQISHALSALGLVDEGVIASMLPNRREYHELRLAAGQSGLYYTPISHHLTSSEVAYILQDSAARLLVVDVSLLDVVCDAVVESGLTPNQVVVVGDVTTLPPWAGHHYEALLAGFGAEAPPSLRAGEFLGYTSGTTGRPKAVRKPLSGKPPVLSTAVLAFMARLGIRPGREVHLVGSPLYHAAPGTFSTIALSLGHTVVISERPRPEELLALIERYRVTVTFTVPTVLGRWLRLPAEQRNGYDLSSLVSVVHAGAPCPPEIKKATIAWLGPVVSEFYGATEGSVTTVTATEWLRKPATVGSPLPGLQIRIVGADGDELPAGEVGQIYYRPPVPVTYHNDPEKTRAATRGDLITTGDMGHVDQDGWLFLADRRTNLIISGGVNIYPAEVEAVMATSPDVADAAVVGVPDHDWGERVVAFLQLEEGVEDEDVLERVEQHLRGRLAGFKVPRELHVVPEVPRTSAGKVLHRRLKQTYQSMPPAKVTAPGAQRRSNG